MYKYDPKIIFHPKNHFGYQNLMLVLNPLKKLQKSFYKKVTNIIKVNGFWCFSSFSDVGKSSKLSSFFPVTFLNGFEISVKFRFFWYPYWITVKNFFWGGALGKLCSQTRTKRLEKTKNGFGKCILEFSSASIKGSGFFTFSKKVKIVVS